MEFEDIDDNVYYTFQDEFEQSILLRSQEWLDFVNNKNIGIKHTMKFSKCGNIIYTIIDKKKWVLTRLRYNI